MFGKKKKNEAQEDKKVAPQPVMAGSDEGSNIFVGDQNDPNRIVLMKQWFVGKPEKDFRFPVDESMISVVYTEDTGYIEEYKTGSIRPADYWEKKFLGYKAKDVSVLSFSDMPFTIATGITFRVPGGDLNGTVRGSFKFMKGDPRAIASVLGSTYAQESAAYDVHRRFITAENLEKILRTAFQDVIRMPLFKETIYSDLDKLESEIRQKVKDTPFFFERSIDVSEISVRPDRTEVEKLEDTEVKHRIQMRLAEMEQETREQAIESAKADADNFKDI